MENLNYKVKKMETELCFGCLPKCIHSDFSGNVIFCHGISESALPFGSSAVVQVNIPDKNNAVCEYSSTHFVLTLVSKCESKYLADYIDGCSNGENSLRGKGAADPSGANECPTSLNNGSHCSFGGSLPEDSPHFLVKCSTDKWERSSINFNTDYAGSGLKPMTLTALAPMAYVGIGSYNVIEDVTRKYLSGTLEDQVISSSNCHSENKSFGGHALNFCSAVGMPKDAARATPDFTRHPNIVPVLGMLKLPELYYILRPKAPYTLESILQYSPKVFESDWQIRLLIYQILSALSYIHELGISHGNVCPANILLTDACWSWLTIFSNTNMEANLNMESEYQLTSKVSCCMESCTSQSLYASLNLSNSMDWQFNFKRWWMGDLSNYDYLLFLNRLAGRRWGDHTFHMVMPWVIDFTVKPDEKSDLGWRDLRKSKWRLAKGDEQLDFTYATSEIPHHVSDECLSELAVCSYKARRLPLSLLRTAVRSVYEPNEYPSSMQRLYQWTPDECIPDFYSDPQIFVSIHSGMSDLAIPNWASCAEEFVQLHRACLESPRVSREIHHWIDIIFGYKMSGEAAITAKNVMLHTANPMTPRSMGRRQLFTHPHPMRSAFPSEFHSESKVLKFLDINLVHDELNMPGLAYLDEVEATGTFCEISQDLSPIYRLHQEESAQNVITLEDHIYEPSSQPLKSCTIDLAENFECFEEDDSHSTCFHELLLWREKLSGISTEAASRDIFAIGCILVELYMKKPLFNPVSFTIYKEGGFLPTLTKELPPDAELLVETMLQRDWRRRPSAKSLLESPFFPASVRLAYLFLAPLNILAGSKARLQYAAKLAKEGALKSMGVVAAEMCAPFCFPLVMASSSDAEAESALLLLVEFLKCLRKPARKALVIPAIQKILQSPDYSHLKVSILQNSFIREIWRQLSKQVYLEKIHPCVISNLYLSSHKNLAAAASVLLIGSCEELGIPVTVHQTIFPLIQCFGKGLGADGIDALVRIGALFGENFIVRQYLPLLRNLVVSYVNASYAERPEPVQSWTSLALIDSLLTLDGLIVVLQRDVVLKELVQDNNFLHVRVLTQPCLDLHVVQVAATTLISLCQKIGPDFTAVHALPQLKELFEELAFSQQKTKEPGSHNKNAQASRSRPIAETEIGNRTDLVLLLYPPLASLLGIERLRQCCTTWLLLEQYLQRYHWKWDCTDDASWIGQESVLAQRLVMSMVSSTDYNPAKLLLTGVGWSIPQPQGGNRGGKSLNNKQLDEFQRAQHIASSSSRKGEPWFWFVSPASSWDGPDFLGRAGSLKDELPWKVRASILHSVRAHPGALRTLVVSHDECTIYTGGVGPGFKGTVQKWELPRMHCVSGYYGHEEVVNDMRILSVNSGRVASCDGTIHIWNSFTGKLISVYAEPSVNSLHSLKASKMDTDESSMLNITPHTGGMLSNTFNGSLYTCMHYTEFDDKLFVGMGNGFLRVIDVAQDQKLNLWKSDSLSYSLSSLVSSICSCGSEKLQEDRTASSTSCISVGLSSGQIRLLDARSGKFVTSWQAHDSHITKLASPDNHFLISSSLDKTLRVWDLRRNGPSQQSIFRGHSDGISAFSIWGQDIISASGNKIGLCSLSGSTNENGQKLLSPRKLYTTDRNTRNLSILSSINILPFSRLFLVGTEDGYLKICS